MDYHLLTGKQREQISLKRLLDMEAEHAGLELDIRIALSTGVNNDNLTGAQQQLALLARQIELLHTWLTPPPVDEDTDKVPVDVAANGDRGN